MLGKVLSQDYSICYAFSVISSYNEPQPVPPTYIIDLIIVLANYPINNAIST